MEGLAPSVVHVVVTADGLSSCYNVSFSLPVGTVLSFSFLSGFPAEKKYSAMTTSSSLSEVFRATSSVRCAHDCCVLALHHCLLADAFHLCGVGDDAQVVGGLDNGSCFTKIKTAVCTIFACSKSAVRTRRY